MKNMILSTLILGAAVLSSCGDKNSAETTEKANEQATLDGGKFLMYYNPMRSMYVSTDGQSLVKTDSVTSYPNMISADAAGTLFSPIYGKKPAVNKSTDGGKTWSEVSSSFAEETWNSYVISAGSANKVYLLSSNGSFFASADGGQNWEKRTTPCAKDTIHSSPAFGMEAWLAVSADGKKLLAQAWYFEETVLAVSEDDGKTWKPVVPPTERNSSRGVGFCGNRIVYASFDQVFTTEDMGKTWKPSTASGLFSPESESSYYGYRHFVTDGNKYVMGVEVPAAESSRNEKNKYPGAIFFSKDGGLTFEIKPFPHNTDPTPTTSDEYVWLTWVKK